MRTWQGICLAAVALLLFGTVCHAQSPEEEYKKLIRVDENIQPLGAHPFGENISLYNGALSFNQTDISLAGNGPLLQLVRQFNADADESSTAVYPAFADWHLDIPHLETLIPGIPPSASDPDGSPMWNFNSSNSPQKIYAWDADNVASPGVALGARCSHFAPPPTVVFRPGDSALSPWDPGQWWKGYHLVLPGEGDKDLLANLDAGSKATYPAVTKDHWRFSCLSTTANGQAGEGFLGQAPDGTKYWFDELVYYRASAMSRQLYNDGASIMNRQSRFVALANKTVETLISLLSGSTTVHAAPLRDSMLRSLGVLLVTKIQDRFGNTLTYSYDSNGLLTGITGNDGRALAIAYVAGTSRIQTVTLQPSSGTPRTWTYSYSADGTSLIDVQLPDNSHWHYDLSAMAKFSLRAGGHSSCVSLGVPVFLNATVGTITHPSGLVGQFTVQPMKHGRSYSPNACEGMQYGDPDTEGSSAAFPDAWYSLTTTSVVFTGAGLSSEAWTYNYSSPNDSWANCAGSCPTTVYTDVVAPDGSTVRNIFSNRYGITETQLQRTEYYSGSAPSSSLLRAVDSYYAPPTTSPLPASAGQSLMTTVDVDQVTKYSPLNKEVVTQNGDIYTRQVVAFNVYVQPTDVKRYSNVTDQITGIEETTTYLNDTGAWVLGLPEQVTNVTSSPNEVESLNQYDANDNLQSRSRFGQTLMNYTFNAAGELATFTDGNGHTTSLGNYKRGIPQTIGYPDSTSETLVVDDLGRISSITDQAVHTTNYSYDAIGRIASISYPGGDEQAWAPQSFTYSFVTGTERGLAANHWKRTSTLGSANTVTYFDAMLRPVLSDSEIGSTVQASTLSTYDSKGQKLFSSYPSGTALTFTQTPHSPATGQPILGTTTSYDALERVTQMQQDTEPTATVPLTTSTVYLSGARQQVTDPKNNVTITSYQVFDEPAYDRVIQVVAPAGITQTIARDVYGNPQSIAQWGPTTAKITKNLFYDGYKRQCRTTEPESHSEVLHYDGANNVDWSIAGVNLDPSDITCGYTSITGGQTSRTYDAMNRVKTILPPSGTQSTTYGYDPVGRMTSAASGDTSWIGTYNFRGMLTGESLQVGAQGPWAIGYAHDANGNLSLIHYPDGDNVSYAPDALGRATRVGNYATGIDYWPNGQVAGFMFGNGTGYTSDQNDRQLLSNFSYTAGSAPQVSEDFGYDNNANIVSVTDLAGATRNKSFGYDALNRLTSANSSLWGGAQSYTYDALNNLLTLTSAGQVATYNYANNLLTGISGAMTASYIYDLRGNVQSKNTTTLSFDLKNQLLSIGSGSAAENFEYDAAGRRVKKSSVAGGDTYYFYNQAGQLMYQTGPGVLNSTDFIYLGTKLIARDVANAPNVSSPAISNNGSFTVSWTSFLGATTYTLQERVNGGAWNTIQSGASTTSAITGKAAGSYGYQVQACNASTCSQWSNVATTTVIYPPAAPATITVPATSSGAVAVSWSASATATGYTMQHRLGAGGWITAYSGGSTSANVGETTTGSYTYQVQACNAGGCSAFKLSSAVAVTIPPASAPALTVPAANHTGGYTVSWSGVTGATSYTLQEQVNGGAWSTIQATSATSKAISGKTNATYGYRVQACNAGGCGPWSTGTVVVTLIPPTPTGLKATIVIYDLSGGPNVQTMSVVLPQTRQYEYQLSGSWNAASGAASYNFQYCQTGGTCTVKTTTATSIAPFQLSGSQFTVSVQACIPAGCSAYSAGVVPTVVRD